MNKPNESKALSLEQRLSFVVDAAWDINKLLPSDNGDVMDYEHDMDHMDYAYCVATFEDYVVVRVGNVFWSVPYTMDENNKVTFAPNTEWTKVEQEWIEAKTAVIIEAKALMKKETDGDHPASHYLVVEDPEKTTTWHLRVRDADGTLNHRLMGAAWAALHEGYRGNKYGGPNKKEAITKLEGLYSKEELSTPGSKSLDDLLVTIGPESLKTFVKGNLGYVEALGLRYGSEKEKDLVGDYFDSTTYFGKSNGNGVDAYLNHRIPLYSNKTTKSEADELERAAAKTFKYPVETTITDVGIVAKHILDLSDKYEKMVFDMASKGALRWSSGSAPHLVDREDNGHIRSWPIIEWSYTPMPTEKRLPRITPVKSLVHEDKIEAPHVNVTKERTMNEQELQIFKDQMAEVFKNVRVVPAPAEGEGSEPTLTDEVKSLSKAVNDLLGAFSNLPGKSAGRLVSETGGSSDKNVKSLSDFLTAVRRNDVKRLITVYNSRHDYEETDVEGKALSEDAGSTGGYLIPTEFMNSLLQVNAQASPILSRVQKITVAGRNGEWPALDQYTAPTAGVGNTALAGRVTTAVTAEAGTLTETTPAFETLKWQVHKIGGYTQASNELIADSPMAIEALLTSLFNVAVNAKLEYFILRGNGVGQPLGILNAASAVGVSPATNSLFSWPDVASMQSRFKQVGTAAPIWLIHPSVWPDILQMEVGTAGANAWVANMQAAQGNMINGYQIVQSEHLPQANNSGDVILADLFGYVLWQRQAISIAFSEHYGFLTDTGTWRFTVRVDGQPWLRNPITLADPQGSYTVSPFVYHND